MKTTLRLFLIGVLAFVMPALALETGAPEVEVSATEASEIAATEGVVFVRMQTSFGDIDLALDAEKAPATVENFVQYAESGYYDRLLFHRVVPGVLIQGGGYTKIHTERETREPVPNEADNGLKNERGTIAMARHTEPHSATSQFFINVKHNERLDFQGKELMMKWGYAVFGKVVSGMEVVDEIASVETGELGPFDGDAPLEPVVIKRIDVIDAEKVGKHDVE